MFRTVDHLRNRRRIWIWLKREMTREPPSEIHNTVAFPFVTTARFRVAHVRGVFVREFPAGTTDKLLAAAIATTDVFALLLTCTRSVRQLALVVKLKIQGHQN